MIPFTLYDSLQVSKQCPACQSPFSLMEHYLLCTLKCSNKYCPLFFQYDHHPDYPVRIIATSDQLYLIITQDKITVMSIAKFRETTNIIYLKGENKGNQILLSDLSSSTNLNNKINLLLAFQ